MSEWSRRKPDPEPPSEPEEGAEGWNPRRTGAGPAEPPHADTDPGDWSVRTRAKTPRERALSRRERAVPERPPEPEPPPAPEPESSTPPAAEAAPSVPPGRPQRAPLARPDAWRSGDALEGPPAREAAAAPAAAHPQPQPPAAPPRDEEAERRRERELAELRARLERAERALPPALRGQQEARGARMRRQAGTAGRLLVALLIFVTVVTAPLLMIYRSSCPQRGIERQRWSFVPPGGDKPEGCRDHQSGLQVLLGQD